MNATEKRRLRSSNWKRDMPDSYWINKLKQKSIFHADSAGRKAFNSGKPKESCPYKQGFYKEIFELAYETERYGLPF